MQIPFLQINWLLSELSVSCSNWWSEGSSEILPTGKTVLVMEAWSAKVKTIIEQKKMILNMKTILPGNFFLVF